MHFREQGRSLQLIRTTYDPEKRRGVQTVVAKLPQYTYSVPGEVRALLTDDEAQQLNDYLAAVQAGRNQQSQAYHLRQLAEDIGKATEALKAGGTPPDPDALWASMAELGKALRKAGHPKPVKARQPAAVPAGQARLV